MAGRLAITNAEVLERARAVFVERGYAARTKQISAAVGLTWGAIALRFGDKQGLFVRAMAEPARTPETMACPHADAEGLPSLLERLRRLLWERWPLCVHVRLAPTTAESDDLAERLAADLTAALQVQARNGSIRSDIGAETLARVVLALLIGDVAQRFVARQSTLSDEPALIDGIVRLLAAQ
jgi:AcrR family transcriptional regulator